MLIRVGKGELASGQASDISCEVNGQCTTFVISPKGSLVGYRCFVGCGMVRFKRCDRFIQVAAKQGELGWLVVLKWKDADRHGIDWLAIGHSERIVQSLPLFCQGGVTTV